jgi:hypothetical protein
LRSFSNAPTALPSLVNDSISVFSIDSDFCDAQLTSMSREPPAKCAVARAFVLREFCGYDVI